MKRRRNQPSPYSTPFMSTHSIDLPLSSEAASLTDARVKLVESIMAAKPSPVHEGAIYTFTPYVEWLRAVSESPAMRAFHVKAAAERLAFALHHDGDRHALKELALYVFSLSLTDPKEGA